VNARVDVALLLFSQIYRFRLKLLKESRTGVSFVAHQRLYLNLVRRLRGVGQIPGYKQIEIVSGQSSGISLVAYSLVKFRLELDELLEAFVRKIEILYDTSDYVRYDGFN